MSMGRIPRAHGASNIMVESDVVVSFCKAHITLRVVPGYVIKIATI
jgi:hypothetical protein